MAVTGQIGDAEVRLDNAADQAVMEKILAEIRQLNGTMTTAGGGGGGGGGGIGNLVTNSGKLGKTLNVVNASFNVLGKTIGAVTGVFSSVISLGSSAVNLTTGFVQAQPKVTDFSKALTNLPGVLGDLGSAIHAVTDMLYKNYTTFQQLSSSGIAFGDRLESMTSIGARLGVSLSDVAGNLASSSEQLARLGTGTRGARMAIDAATEAFAQNKDILLAYGMSFEEQNENFIKFFGQNTLALQRGTITQRQLIDMSDDYAKGLRRLSELTGIQADQLQEGVDKANMNRAFENFISKMDGETQNRMRAILNTVQAGFGDAGREAAMATIMGVAPITQGAANMVALNRDFGGMLRGLNSSALGFSGSLEQFNTMMYGQMNQYANANRNFADSNSKYFATITMLGNEFGDAGGALIGGINMFSGSVDDIETRLGRRSPLNNVFAQLELTIQEVRESFAILVQDLLYDPRFQAGITAFANGIRSAGPAIAQFVGDFATAEGRERNLQKIFDALEAGVHELMLRLNDFVLFDLLIDDDTLKAREKEQLQERVNAGTLDRPGLEAMTTNRELLAPTRNAARELLNEMNTQDSRAGETARASVMDQFNRELREMVARGNGIGLDMSRPLSSGEILSFFPPGTDIDTLTNGLFASRAELGEFIERFNRLAQYKASGLPGATIETSNGAGVNRMAEALGYQTRHFGTYGMTGRIIEPRGTFARLRPGETVHTQAESRAINELLRGGSGGIDGLANKIVDSNRESSVKSLEALNILARKIDDHKQLTRQLISAVEHYGT